MNLRSIYEKVSMGNFVTDAEINYAIPLLIDTEANLLDLGEVFHLSRKEVSRVLGQLQQWKNCRKIS